MQPKLNLTTQAQSLLEHGFTLTNSARSRTIYLVHVKTGETRTEHVLQDYWEDDDFRWGCESAWAKDGFRLVQAICL
jgi:hypothetical protein